MREFNTFEEFWLFYLSQHARPATRWMHALGTIAGLAWLLWCMHSGNFRLIPIALVLGYGPAWLSHFAIERNRPATFTYPLWSFYGDFRMLWRLIVAPASLQAPHSGAPTGKSTGQS